MKYLVLLAVLVVFIWHWRSNRRADIAERKRKVPTAPGPSTGPVDMVECAHCHLHLARPDALAGRQGNYCSAEHRALAES